MRPHDWPATARVANRVSRCEVLPLSVGLSAVEIEDSADHLMDGLRLRIGSRRFQSCDRRMQELVDNTASHGVNGGFLFGCNAPQLAAYAVNFRLADGLTIFLERKNCGHNGQRLHARSK